MREKHLESIRKACVAANAENDGTFNCDNCERPMLRPLRLADVLLAMGKRKNVEPLTVDEYGNFEIGHKKQYVTVREHPHLSKEAKWNLRDDRLEALKDEDLAFIASLLTGDTV